MHIMTTYDIIYAYMYAYAYLHMDKATIHLADVAPQSGRIPTRAQPWPAMRRSRRPP